MPLKFPVRISAARLHHDLNAIRFARLPGRPRATSSVDQHATGHASAETSLQDESHQRVLGSIQGAVADSDATEHDEPSAGEQRQHQSQHRQQRPSRDRHQRRQPDRQQPAGDHDGYVTVHASAAQNRAHQPSPKDS